MKLAVSLLVLAACSALPATPDAPLTIVDARAVDAPIIDTPADASGPDLMCLGQSPTAAPDPLLVEGKLFAVDHYDITPVVGATVVLRRRGTDAAIVQTTTAADGAFTMSVVSHGVPVDGYFTVTAAGYRPTRVEPGDPLSGGENALMLVADDAEMTRWYAAAGVAFTAGVSTLITATVDCARDTLDGSTIAVAPSPGTVTYYDATGKQWDTQLATSTNGYALVTGAASSVAVTGQLGAVALPPHAITVPAGTLTIAVLTPRSWSSPHSL
jgi:hypothetical protein